MHGKNSDIINYPYDLPNQWSKKMEFIHHEESHKVDLKHVSNPSVNQVS